MASPRADELLAVAHIVKPHGIRGEMSAVPLAPAVLDPQSLILRRLFARDAQGGVREVEGLSMRPHKDRWLITLAGVETMDDALTCRNIDLCLRRTELPELPEGWFWEVDLEGCQVIDKVLGPIGSFAGLEDRSAQSQLIIQRPDGAKALIPWVRAFIMKVDLEAREIRTDLPAEFPGISASTSRDDEKISGGA